MKTVVNKITIIFLSILSIMLFIKCGNPFADDKLSLPLTPYIGNQLRIDGYYYYIGTDIDGGKFFKSFIFYRNGVILDLGSGYNSTIELEERLNKYNASPESFGKAKHWWGVYLIENSIIKVENWYPASINWKACIREGVILNDTTFHITKSYCSGSRKVNTQDEVYHFRQFSPKPDSTNNFIR